MIPCRAERIQKESVDTWYAKWEALCEQIHASHEVRDGQARELMAQGITLFEMFMIEGSMIDGNEEVPFEQLELMPLNGSERLAFIKKRPDQYACYRQLDELFKETKKRAARLRLKASF